LRRVTEPYRHSITATDADIDELGHVSNLVYLRWVLETATTHSAARGWGHAEYRALGAIFIVRRHELDYLAQVTAGQQLVAETWVESWRAASCIRRTRIARDTTIVAQAATTWVCMSLATGKPTRIPDHLRARFE
jgi:acyl-CoA thioester hydrolase